MTKDKAFNINYQNKSFLDIDYEKDTSNNITRF